MEEKERKKDIKKEKRKEIKMDFEITTKEDVIKMRQRTKEKIDR